MEVGLLRKYHGLNYLKARTELARDLESSEEH